LPGAPSIYYGDEIGLEGGEDPANRACMIWDRSCWNTELWQHYRKVIALRKRIKALRRGEWRLAFSDDALSVCGFVRTCGDEVVLIVVHNGSEPVQVSLRLEEFGLPPEVPYEDWLGGVMYRPSAGQLTIDHLQSSNAAVLAPLSVAARPQAARPSASLARRQSSAEDPSGQPRCSQ
jgi:cyclomaltodextrinase / maltogenic alpha-amylase / neopullulanase